MPEYLDEREGRIDRYAQAPDSAQAADDAATVEEPAAERGSEPSLERAADGLPAQPLVSVIITTYRRTAYLREAIASALRQSYQSLEIIVSDDGEGDEVEGLVASFGDPRLRYRRNPERLGVAGNTLVASLEARGEYVAYLNDDDAWEAHFVATLLPPLEADPELSVAFADHHVMTAEGVIQSSLSERNSRLWGRDTLRPGVHRPFCRLALLKKSVPMVMAALIRRSAIEWDDFPPEVGPGYDLWLAYLACRTGLGAYYEAQRLTRYRAHPQGQTSSARIAHSQGVVYCYGRFLADPRLGELRTELVRKHAEALAGHSAALLRQRPGREARHAALAAFQAGPSGRTLAGLLVSLLPVSLARAAMTTTRSGD